MQCQGGQHIGLFNLEDTSENILNDPKVDLIQLYAQPYWAVDQLKVM